MKIYLAASYEVRKEMRVLASELLLCHHSFQVCSTWQDSSVLSNDEPYDRVQVLGQNISDMLVSDVCLCFLDRGEPFDTLADLGYCLSLGKRAVVITHPHRRRSIFSAHRNAVEVDAATDGRLFPLKEIVHHLHGLPFS